MLRVGSLNNEQLYKIIFSHLFLVFVCMTYFSCRNIYDICTRSHFGKQASDFERQ